MLYPICDAQQMRIGILRDFDVKKINFIYDKGSYSIFADTTEIGSMLSTEFIELSIGDSNKILLKRGVVEVGTFSKIRLVENQPNNSIAVLTKIPALKTRKYKDDFEIFLGKKGLTIVNLVELDNYLGGVVESEGGGANSLEYFKVQTLMSRTYAMKYKHRHIKDSFDLCDRVHCQAYKQMVRFNPLIDSAVAQTHDLVLVDEDAQLIDTYFHANCGGQTCEPDYVWNTKIPYLHTFIDTFCIYTKQANWEVRIKQDEWRNFLVDKYHYPIEDSIYAASIFTFDQPQRRAFYINPALGIPLRDLREEFHLKSTFFSCYPEGDEVVIKGKGYGHGVGLCQEGAMKMAKYGLTYTQICEYYFPGALIQDIDLHRFFKQ